jgi:hypothetical protein
MPSFVTESNGELVIERRAPQKSEEELREARTQKLAAGLERALASSDRKPEFIDTMEVRRAIAKPEDQLEREAGSMFRDGFRRLMAEAASKE